MRHILQGILLLTHLFHKATGANVMPVPGKVTPKLKQIIQEKQAVDIIVSFDIPSSITLQKISKKTRAISNRGEKLTMISDGLENQALISQKGALELLKREKSLKYRVLWITNQLSIKGASTALVDKLTAIDEVTKIDADAQFEIIEPKEESDGHLKDARPLSRSLKYSNIQYGIEKLKVPEVWSQGYYGQGIVVGIMDFGANIMHDIIRDTFVGTSNYGWFDPADGQEFPYDPHHSGHGTHVTGTVVGHNGIGVAPGSRWMSCKLTSEQNIFPTSAIACLQHFLCPGDKFGGNRNCSKAPRVICNSWGLEDMAELEDVYPAVFAFKNTDTFLVFAIGNYGPKCESVVYPGGLPDIFSVGATNYLDEVSPFSSSGSGANETVKPEIVAPGIDIWSSILGQHIMYLSGTSMAAPHVTGVVALLLSKNPNLTNKEIWDILIKSTDPVTITKTPDQCESIPLEKYPNNRAGYGRLNALKAINNVKLP